MKRSLDNSILNGLTSSTLWINKLKQDCIKGKVFLAIRNNRVDFYHEGGKLFSYDGEEYETHHKYASVINPNGKTYLKEPELSTHCKFIPKFEPNYKRIKENCSKYSKEEAKGVSCLYCDHSYMSGSEVVILDIEIAFKALDNDRKIDQIDLLLFNKRLQKLQFVEAKHYSNKEVVSKTIPKVIGQIKRYQSQIKTKGANILSEYVDYVQTLNLIFDNSLPQPKEIDEKVTLLIFGFDNDQKFGRLTRLVGENEAYSDERVYYRGNLKGLNPTTLWNA